MNPIAAVIADGEDEIPAILAPFDLKDDTTTFVTETHDDYLKRRRALDRNIADGDAGGILSVDARYAPKAARERLAMGDDELFDAWVGIEGCDVDEDGNIVISFNENGFYDSYETNPEGLGDIQGVGTARLLQDPGIMPENTEYIVHDDEWEYTEDLGEGELAGILEAHPGQRVWFVTIDN